jgi:dTDP-4-amino-4,6-dideoxygalactose transaminase
VDRRADASLSAVPFVDLRRQPARLAHELQAAFERVVAAGDFILGDEVERFERNFADYCGVGHCVGVASGTAALTIAMIAAGVGPGDEVIVPAHTFISTALAVRHAGATPVLADVHESTGLLDPSSAAAVLSPRTVAVLPVHLYGQVCDMDAIGAFARRHGLALFEDCAQAPGATFGDRRAGSFGVSAGFSFYPTKNLGALGDGGAICTSDPEVAERARRLRNLGQRRKGEHVEVGFNERLDALQAALLGVKLPELDSWNLARRAHARAYRTSLPASVRLADEDPRGQGIYHVFPIRVRDREALAASLGASGIGTGVHYSRALHQHAALAGVGQVRTSLDAAEAWAREELSLPMFAELEEPEVARVVEACHATCWSAAG